MVLASIPDTNTSSLVDRFFLCIAVRRFYNPTVKRFWCWPCRTDRARPNATINPVIKVKFPVERKDGLTVVAHSNDPCAWNLGISTFTFSLK